ncbi:hypothetical protein Egran_06609 [Elaphomyces granulatus]|uniref:ATP11 protein n=1 Tax=Elaphomyces granulatus TaxID=519963 RepID=A0A232LNC6_9EURO|nr:hypothetical protein Egran_06609 [Elaphomyces granulatus]
MLSFRSIAVGNVLRSHSQLLVRAQQRRWAQVHDVRFLATHRDPNRVLEKYKEKLDRKAKEEGHNSIESLKEAYKDRIAEYRWQESTVTASEFLVPSASSISKSSTPSNSVAIASAAASSQSTTGVKPLSSFLDVDKVLALPSKEIEMLWRLRHANDSRSICAVIPLDTYQRMASTARSHPQFILPLPRQAEVASEGSEGSDGSSSSSLSSANAADIHFLQWGFHPPPSSLSRLSAACPPSSQTAKTHTSTIVFTHLAAYKLHGSYAQPHTTVTHYLDLADEKGLVLMHGQVMPDRGISATEASWLVSSVQRFYDSGVEDSGRKGELLRMFTQGDSTGFKVEDLMEEMERLS